jgi:YVTN family beta-propeller protein
VLRTFASHILVLTLLSAGCMPPPAGLQAQRGNQGELLLYLAGLPPEANRLSFSLAGASALRADGTAIPLSLRMTVPTGPGSDRQRLLATGLLPPGSYHGIALTVENAQVATEEGEMALLTPEKPVVISVPFNVSRRGATLLEIIYRQAGSIQQHVRFVPAFFASRPEPPVVTRLAFASVPSDDHVLVFDRTTLKAITAIALEGEPAGMALDEAGNRLFVALSEQDAVAVIDILSGALLDRIPLQLGDRPDRLALTPDGNLLLCVNPGSDSVSLIDPHSLVELSRLDVGDEPHSLALDPAGRRAFIFNLQSDSISVLDLNDSRLLFTQSTDSAPIWGALNRDGRRLYVIYRSSPYLNVLDPATLAAIERQQVGIGTDFLLVDARTDLVYLGWADEPRIDIFDPFSLQAVDFLDAPGGGAVLAIDDEENRLLVGSTAGSVTAVDLVSKRQAGRVDVSGPVHSLVLEGARH